MQSFPIFEEYADSEAFSRYLDVLQTEQDSRVGSKRTVDENDTIVNEIKSDSSDLAENSQQTKNVKKTTKMVIVNGYVTFVEEEADKT